MPFVPSLQKNIWANYIPPYKDELFTSWYVRLAQSHMVKSHSFGKYYFGNQQFWNRDTDNMPTSHLKRIIYENSPLEYADIDDLFLTSYKYKLFEHHNPTGYTLGILPLGIRHRIRKQRGLLYCPVCLKNKPYYKKQWRLSISYVCCNCKVLLKDSCPACKYPITFHRLEQGNKKRTLIDSFNLCAGCNYDLTLSSITASDEQFKNQICIDNILNSGYSKNIHYSFSYFHLFHIINNLLSRKHKVWGRLRNACEFEFGILPENEESFRFWPIEDRLSIFEMTCKIINDYDFLRYLIQNHNLRLSEFNKDQILPYSFEHIFKSF
ncbi:TniQ family protein [uncultured Chryseobacterium sp.]|uniref:TniQ family protein n=1 Tax=uncultured Chryseobacterium sp. TaxID=259322 RepID=UPI0025DAF722|nr:TniQ family protein [uncultured Chryseobacterium sp.]